MKISDSNEDEPILNLTPMIDVVFQLLIFFMVATTFLDPEKEIGIELPEATSGVASEEAEELIINIFADGRIVLSGREIPSDDLLSEHDPRRPPRAPRARRAGHGRLRPGRPAQPGRRHDGRHLTMQRLPAPSTTRR